MCEFISPFFSLIELVYLGVSPVLEVLSISLDHESRSLSYDEEARLSPFRLQDPKFFPLLFI